MAWIPGAPVPCPDAWDTSPYDNLALPGNTTVGALRGADLARKLIALNIPGASFSKGRRDNAAAYAAYVTSLQNTSGASAFATWLSDN